MSTITLKIRRDTWTDISTIGELTIDGEHFCYTLERAKIDPQHPCIPAGVYGTILGHNDRMGLDVYLLLKVPGRTGILIHPANWANELRGCIAVGVQKGADYIGQSRAAFEALMKKCEGSEVVVDIA